VVVNASVQATKYRLATQERNTKSWMSVSCTQEKHPPILFERGRLATSVRHPC
jgi:hypothetical protein